MNLSKETYLKNPCRASALPYWKAVRLAVPEDMLVLHEFAFHAGYLTDYTDEPYFRLYHDLQGLPPAVLPDGLQLFDAAPADYGAHISRCYTGMSAAAAEIGSYVQHSVYSADLWVAVRERESGKIAGTGIAEFDAQMGEGILEWIQVSPECRGRGFGTSLVAELLHRIAAKAEFATVSGQVRNPSEPEKLYRKCGFTGNDVWHVLRKK